MDSHLPHRNSKSLHFLAVLVSIGKLLSTVWGHHLTRQRRAVSTPADLIVNIQELVKTYPGKTPVEAVKGIDLSVARGELFGLLGPNGAGKTTTISVCTTRALPTSGQVTIAGVDVVAHPAEARRFMGMVTQFNTLDRQCTVWENLYFHCRYFGFSHAQASQKTTELLELFKLNERSKAFPRELSGGLAQRVQIARAIAHEPQVLFLDEPSAGLDPQTRLALWDIIRVLREKGITIVLTTHYMEEADQLCDRVAIIDHGKILVCDTPDRLKEQRWRAESFRTAPSGCAGGQFAHSVARLARRDCRGRPGFGIACVHRRKKWVAAGDCGAGGR